MLVAELVVGEYPSLPQPRAPLEQGLYFTVPPGTDNAGHASLHAPLLLPLPAAVPCSRRAKTMVAGPVRRDGDDSIRRGCIGHGQQGGVAAGSGTKTAQKQ